jgi:hypothetical protein
MSENDEKKEEEQSSPELSSEQSSEQSFIANGGVNDPRDTVPRDEVPVGKAPGDTVPSVDDTSVKDMGVKDTKEYWSSNPYSADYTTPGDKKSWSFYLSHRGKPKGQSPKEQSSNELSSEQSSPEPSSVEESPERPSSEEQSHKEQSSEQSPEKGGNEEAVVSDIKGKNIPLFHGKISSDSVKNDEEEKKSDEKENKKEEEERKKAERAVCLSKYLGDEEIEKEYDKAVFEGRDPVEAVNELVAKRKGSKDSSKDSQGGHSPSGQSSPGQSSSGQGSPVGTDSRANGSRDGGSKEIKMKIILGKANTRGNSDVVDNFDADKAIAVGTVVKRTDEDAVAVFDGTGAPIGVAGYRQVEGQGRIAVNLAGLGIGVLLANPLEEIVVGGQVYVTKEGKVTGISKDNAGTGNGNTMIRAIFVSKKGDGVDVVKKTTVKDGAVRIDMLVI